MSTSDHEASKRVGVPSLPDPHGQAALLLVESLIHGLCERSALSVNEAVEIVERAATVQEDVAEVADGAAAPMWRSHALLLAIAESLKIDGDDGHDGSPVLRSVP